MKSRKFSLWMLLAFIFCTAFCTVNTACSDDNDDNIQPTDKDTTALTLQKIAVIDAGSTGSRLYVYEIHPDSTIEVVYPITSDEEKASKGRAISSVANDADSVSSYVSSMTAKYTVASGEKIPLYIFATAGMRLVSKATTDALYKKIANAKDAMHGFEFKNAMTISGRYEGLYAWIADNYANGHLKSTTRGIVESGGASIQVAFLANTSNIPAAQKLTRNGWGTIYSKSYLGAGTNVMYEKTPKAEPYVFDIQVDDVSAYIGDTQFYGCGGIKYLLKGIKKFGSFDGYVATLTDDPNDSYHNYFSAYYVQWLFGQFGINNRVSLPDKTPNWTEGAAYDIIVNRQAPEAFDYDKQY